MTLVGPGGVGKSRLALQVAAELSAEYSGGAWFVSLGSLTEPDLVADALTDALGLGERRGETAEETLVQWFANREALLVVDNCEHLLDAVAAIVDRLLDVDSGSTDPRHESGGAERAGRDRPLGGAVGEPGLGE